MKWYVSHADVRLPLLLIKTPEVGALHQQMIDTPHFAPQLFDQAAAGPSTLVQGTFNVTTLLADPADPGNACRADFPALAANRTYRICTVAQDFQRYPGANRQAAVTANDFCAPDVTQPVALLSVDVGSRTRTRWAARTWSAVRYQGVNCKYRNISGRIWL